ncbi:hypothetical protein PPYR_13980 [Photinus pyralis]|uniref:Peptidase S1 domain-containing protein n=2 Tax=Photinus pyralis TaxID=7054 RepID=A0A5N4A422_PHOPY|nr:trypsin-1-like [Photinus pyralis]KAB0792019.1 hypothetical protein PPYR_13980 [Photinus pyralis]
MELVFLVLVVFPAGLAAIHNFADVACGRRSERRTAKVVGGEDAAEGEFPWLVSLTRRGAHFCGGSLITDRHVLSAGHCLCSGSSEIPAGQIRVTLGQHVLSEESAEKFEVAVKSSTLHPDYTCGKVKNDLAILELERQVKWSDVVHPACLPAGLQEDGHNRFVDVLATVAGWGWTNENNNLGSRGDRLQKAKVNILEREQCQRWFKSQGKKTKIQETQICAGYEQGGIDSCWADSGGPLMTTSDSGEKIIVVGVVSTGIGCARPSLPGIYTRVSDYIPWIRSVVKT